MKNQLVITEKSIIGGHPKISKSSNYSTYSYEPPDSHVEIMFVYNSLRLSFYKTYTNSNRSVEGSVSFNKEETKQIIQFLQDHLELLPNKK